VHKRLLASPVSVTTVLIFVPSRHRLQGGVGWGKEGGATAKSGCCCAQKAAGVSRISNNDRHHLHAQVEGKGRVRVRATRGGGYSGAQHGCRCQHHQMRCFCHLHQISGNGWEGG
jgi:hypothetical protein